MKNLLKPSLYLAALVAISGVFYACSDEEITDVSPTEGDFTVRVNNGYLEFKDQATFDRIKTVVEDKDSAALEAWEAQFEGFTSLRSVEEKAIDAQEIWFSQLRNMSEEERLVIQQSDDDFWYSDYIKDNLSTFILGDSGIFSLNLVGPATSLIPLLNKDGIYKIGDEIHVYNSNVLKIIHDGDDSKLQMLSGIDENNDELNVSVYYTSTQPLGSASRSDNGRQSVLITNTQQTKCQDVIGSQRVIGEAYIARSYIPDGSGFQITYLTVKATNYNRDGLFGGYTRKRTRFLKIEGNLNLYINGVFQGSSGDFVFTTGGRLRTTISENAYIATSTAIQTFTSEAVGTINVFGRGGTRCGDHGIEAWEKWQ